MSDVPLAWGDAEPSQLVIVYPRHQDGSLYNSTKIYVNGEVWGGRHREGLQFAGQLELEDLVPSPTDLADPQ